MALYELLRPWTRLWYASKLHSLSRSPQPRDSPSVLTGDREGDHQDVLLIGNGPAHGWGVLSHELALTGYLSREIATATERGTRVDLVGDEHMNLASTADWIGDTDLSGYDAVVIMVGVNDAIRITAVDEWSKNLRLLLDALLDRLDLDTSIVVAGIPRPSSVALYQGWTSLFADRHARRLNRASMAVIDSIDRVSFFSIALPRSGDDTRVGSPSLYAQLGKMTAAAVIPGLEAARRPSFKKRARLSAPPKWEWTGSPHVIELARSGGSPELRRIAASARKRFDVRLAVVSLLEGNRLWYATPDGLPLSVPRQLSYCHYVAAGATPLVVNDTRLDRRFKASPLIDLQRVLFYAGIPLFSSSGAVIGTFCLMGAHARGKSGIELKTLLDMGLEVQQELWKYESPDPVTEAVVGSQT